MSKEKLIALYREMYELTEPECRCSCLCPQTCCSPEYCEMAITVAKSCWGVDISDRTTSHDRLPFMGENGCVLEPHFRPLCTLHTCDILSWGFKMLPKPDPEWDKKYYRLRDAISELESELFHGG